MTDEKVQIVIRINLRALLTPNDHQTIYNVLFGRRGVNETPNIRTLVNRYSVGTRTKMTLKDDEDTDEILIFWRYDDNFTTLPRFESELISLYQQRIDRKFDLLSKDKTFLLISTNTVRILSPPELMYLKKQIEDYLDRKKALDEIELLCKDY